MCMNLAGPVWSKVKEADTNQIYLAIFFICGGNMYVSGGGNVYVLFIN